MKNWEKSIKEIYVILNNVCAKRGWHRGIWLQIKTELSLYFKKDSSVTLSIIKIL